MLIYSKLEYMNFQIVKLIVTIRNLTI